MMDWVSMWPAALVGGMAATILGGAAWQHQRSRKSAPDDARKPSDANEAPRARKQGRPAAYDKLDSVADWEPSSTRLLTHAEREACHLLRKALPDYLVFAQVPMARFIKVPTRNSYAEWQRRVGSLCVDLVICDMATNVLAAIEVRKSTDDENERVRRRHKRMDKVLKAADIPVHIWTEGALPHPKAVRESVLGADRARVSADDKAAFGENSRGRRDAEAAAVVAAMRTGGHTQGLPAQDSRLDFNLDEADLEPPSGDGRHASTHRDPPPSTWFDDLDATMPAPLDEAEPAPRAR